MTTTTTSPTVSIATTMSSPQPNTKSADTISLSSTASAFSTCPDRHGFYGGSQFTDKPKAEVLSRAQIISREKKWLHMISHWNEYMNKNYKKVFIEDKKLQKLKKSESEYN